MGAYSDGKEILRDVIHLAKGISDMELKNKILELQSQFYELNDENRELRLENEELKNRIIRRDELEWKNNAYKKKNTEDEIYCPRCLDSEEKLIRMQMIVPAFSVTYSVKCPKCNTEAETDIRHGIDTSYVF